MWTDDISFCPIEKCRRKTCRRNQQNIRDRTIPHSFFVERPPDCPYRKKQDDFYHIRKKAVTSIPDRKKILTGLEFTKAMITFNPSTGEDIDPDNLNEADKTSYDACVGAIAMLKEQEKLVDVDALREKLGLAKDCAKCKQNTRACQYDSHFSLMDFCERFDMAIEELMQEGWVKK